MNTKDAKVGDEVFVCRQGSVRTDCVLGEVSKISPSGQITVYFGPGREPRRFGANGREIGGAEYLHPAFLDFNVDARRAANRAASAREAAVAAVRKIAPSLPGRVGYRPSKEVLLAEVERLEALLAAARAAVEAM